MFKLMQKARKNQKGFTLVELMVVVVIIGVLTAIAIPIFNNVQLNSRRNAHNANVRILQGAAAQMLAENAPLPAASVTWRTATPRPMTARTDWGHYLESWPVNPLPAGHAQAGVYEVDITVAGLITVRPAAVAAPTP